MKEYEKMRKKLRMIIVLRYLWKYWYMCIYLFKNKFYLV